MNDVKIDFQSNVIKLYALLFLLFVCNVYCVDIQKEKAYHVDVPCLITFDLL